MLHKASELTSAQRLAVESLLGRSIADEETVSIRAFEAAPAQDKQSADLLAELHAYFARIDAKRPPVAADDDAIINEALRSTRPNYRPIR